MKLISTLFFAILILTACKAEQKVIFSGDSISYKNKDSYMQSIMASECKSLSEDLDDYLKKGWKVIASSSKEKIVASNTGTCKGTEYILEK
jgi:hypothetical protein